MGFVVVGRWGHWLCLPIIQCKLPKFCLKYPVLGTRYEYSVLGIWYLVSVIPSSARYSVLGIQQIPSSTQYSVLGIQQIPGIPGTRYSVLGKSTRYPVLG